MTFRLPRRPALLAAFVVALPVTCSQSGDGLYNASVQPSPASRVNPFESGITNDGGHSR